MAGGVSNKKLVASFRDADLGGEIRVLMSRPSWLSSLTDMAFGLNTWEDRTFVAILPTGKRYRLAVVASDYDESYARDRVQRSIAAGGALGLATEFRCEKLSRDLDVID